MSPVPSGGPGARSSDTDSRGSPYDVTTSCDMRSPPISGALRAPHPGTVVVGLGTSRFSAYLRGSAPLKLSRAGPTRFALCPLMIGKDGRVGGREPRPEVEVVDRLP